MLWPSRLSEAQGPRISTRQSSPSAAESRCERGWIQGVRARIQRNGDVGLRGRNEIHRHALVLEHLERIGEKSDLMPHAGTVHGDQRDALLDGDRLHLSGAVGDIRADHGALEARGLSGIHVKRNPVLAHRQDAARMQNLRAVARDLLRLVVMQRAQQPRGGDRPRIGAEHSRDIGPDLQARCGQLGREIRARGIRASAAEQHRLPRIVRGDESLSDDDSIERSPSGLQSLVRREVARGRQQARLHVRAMAVLGMQHRARIHPGGRNSLCVQERGAQAGRHELAHRHDVRAHPIVEPACPFRPPRPWASSSARKRSKSPVGTTPRRCASSRWTASIRSQRRTCAHRSARPRAATPAGR